MMLVFTLLLSNLLSYAFSGLARLCLCVDLFLFILCGIFLSYSSAWINSFIKFGQFFSLFLHIFLCPFVSFPSGSPVMQMFIPLVIFHRSPRLCSFFSFFFLCFSQLDYLSLPTFRFTDFFFSTASADQLLDCRFEFFIHYCTLQIQTF